MRTTDASRRLQWARGPPSQPTQHPFAWTARFRPGRLSSRALALVYPASPLLPPPPPPAPQDPRALLALVATLLALCVGTGLLAWHWRRALVRHRERRDRHELVRRISKRTVSELLRCLRPPPKFAPPPHASALAPRYTRSLRRVASRRRRRDASDMSLPLRSVATSITSFLASVNPPHAPAEEQRPRSSPFPLSSLDELADAVVAFPDVGRADEARSEKVDDLQQPPAFLSILNAAGDVSEDKRAAFADDISRAESLPLSSVPSEATISERKEKLPKEALLCVDLSDDDEDEEDSNISDFDLDTQPPLERTSEAGSAAKAPSSESCHPMTPLLPARRRPSARSSTPPASAAADEDAMAPTGSLLPPTLGLGDDGIMAPEPVPAELLGWWQRQREFEQEAEAAVARGRLSGSVAVARHLLYQLRVLKRWRARRQRRDGEGDVSQQAQEKFLEVSMCFLLAVLALLARVDRVHPEDMAPCAEDFAEEGGGAGAGGGGGGPSTSHQYDQEEQREQPKASTCRIPL